MEREEDPGEGVESAAGEMESDLEQMESRSEEVGEHIHEARSDWERKQQDAAVPGADPGDEAEATGDPAGEPAEAGDAEDDGPEGPDAA